MMTVYCDGQMHKMTLNELKEKGWNVVVNKTNGYSHDWEEVYPFDESLIKNIGGIPTIWCTTKPIGRVMGSSVVSFS